MNTSLLEALNFQNHSRPPVWLMRQAGRYMPSYQALRKKYSFLQICHEPELIHQVTLLPIKEFNFDAAILFSDILMIPEALGFKVRFEDHSGPLIDNHLKAPHEINHFSTEHLREGLNFLPPAIRELKKTLSIPLLGFAGAPFTLASYIIEGKTSRELKTTKRWAYEDSNGFERILALLEEAVIQSLKLQIDSGCDAVQLFDSWAHVLTQEHFTKWCLKPLTRIVQALNKPLIYFCRGSSYRATMIAPTGASVSVDWTHPIDSVRKLLPTTPLQGNLDPEALYLPKEKLIAEVQKILHSMHHDPGYIFNLGHGILPETPYENVQALVSTVHNYSSKA